MRTLFNSILQVMMLVIDTAFRIFKNKVFQAIFFFLLLPPLALFSADSPHWEKNHVLDTAIKRGIDATILQNYSLAYSVFDSLIAKNPDDPRGYFYKAAAIQSKMMDLEDYSEGDVFERYIQKTIRLSNRMIHSYPGDGWGYFYAGSGYSYYALYLIHEKKYFKGIRLAQKGMGLLNRAVSLDSTVFDAYLGIGTYEYWRSRKTKFLKWLPIFPDRTKDGIRKIKLAFRKSRFARSVSLNELIWVEIDRGNWKAAIDYARQGLEQYPGSRFFLWPLAEAYFRGGFHHQAANAFADLLKTYEKETLSNHYNEAICAYKVAISAFFDHDYVRSKKYCEMFLSYARSPKIKKRLNRKKKEIRKILEEDKKILSRITLKPEQKNNRNLP
ncbi:MAG: hypothetical protein GXO76_10890 [Calditrichaeota bacterium]|nr:hypothetical protein [Calditrichota bacterium]